MTTLVVKIDPRDPDEKKIKKVAGLLQAGGLVAYPTETVYGLAAAVDKPEAIERLYKVKRRPRDKPFSLQIASKEKIEDLAANIPTLAYKFIDRFWPGPLTLVLDGRGAQKVGIRMPANKIALSIIEQAGTPLACPSANLSGNPPPRNLKEVLRDLNGLIDMAVDAGQVRLGIESTVVDLTVSPFGIIRQGAISLEELRRVERLKTVLFVCTGNSCRSVMAKALLEKMASKENLELEINACGVAAFEGAPASQSAQELLSKEGIDIFSHRARRLTEWIVKKADFIFVMEATHKDEILGRLNQAQGKIYLLREFAKGKDDLQIPDPMSKPIQDYEKTLKIIKDSLGGVIKFLKY